jgi:hypothetical protein
MELPMHRAATPWILASVLALACAAADDGEVFEHQVQDGQDEVDDLRTAVDAHLAETMQAPDLESLQALEGPHHEETGRYMGDLDHVIGDMHMCGIDDDDHLGAMEGMYDACNDELGRHRDTIASAADLDAALAEEDRHHAAMLEQLDGFDTTLGEMMDDDADEMCHGHHGMHDHHGG